MVEIAREGDVAGVVAVEKVCDSVQKSCNGGGRGFRRKEIISGLERGRNGCRWMLR